MYELTLHGQARERFKQAAKRKMREKRWHVKELAEATGRTQNTIYAFFKADGNDLPQRFLTAEIANVLEMTRKDWE